MNEFSEKATRFVDKVFLQHPREAGEPFFQHLGFTIYVAAYLIITAACALIHGLCPCVLKTATSDRVRRLNEIMAERRERLMSHTQPEQ